MLFVADMMFYSSSQCVLVTKEGCIRMGEQSLEWNGVWFHKSELSHQLMVEIITFEVIFKREE